VKANIFIHRPELVQSAFMPRKSIMRSWMKSIV